MAMAIALAAMWSTHVRVCQCSFQYCSTSSPLASYVSESYIGGCVITLKEVYSEFKFPCLDIFAVSSLDLS